MAEQPKDDFKHIMRIVNIDVPGGKQVRWALTKIKGIGINMADMICIAANVNRTGKAGYLKPEEVERLNAAIQDPAKAGLPIWSMNRRRDYDSGDDMHVVTGNLQFVHDNDLKRLKKIKSYKGVRHIKGLPARGQRTRSNFRKSKGKVVGVAKKKAPAKK
jgi:small subunit ribosomal protein S13